MLQQRSREMKGKQSGVIVHEKLESDLIPNMMTNSFSNTKYGQNFKALEFAQKSMASNENGNLVSKSSPPATSAADSEHLKSGYADSALFQHQTSTGVSKLTSGHVKGGSNALSQ